MNSIKNLISGINRNLITSNSNLLLNYNLIKNYNGNDYRKYISYSNKTYKKNLVYRNEDFELFVICWKDNDASLIHDHSENGCLFKILEGELREYKYDKELKFIKKVNLRKNNTSYLDNNIGYHKIENKSNNNSVSLHLYSPPRYIANKYYID
jgi:cysteine dioxygenase